MATLLEDDGMKLLFELEIEGGAEYVQFGFYTGLRDESEFGDLHTAMMNFLSNISDGTASDWLTGYTNVTTKLQGYNSVFFGYDHWYTLDEMTHDVEENQAKLPPQIACVVSLNSNDPELSPRRRRNRSYLAPIFASRVDADGRFNAPSAQGLITDVQTFHTALQGITVGSNTPAVLGGLSQVSYRGTSASAAPQITNAERVRVGLIPDTQRRRRNALPESYEFANLSIPT